MTELYAEALGEERLSREVETTIYRIIREASNNVLKHAEASRVDVVLERVDGIARLIIEDNGRGFDPEVIPDKPDGSPHLGLVGMRERVALVGGELNIESTPGSGTTLFVQIPLTS